MKPDKVLCLYCYKVTTTNKDRKDVNNLGTQRTGSHFTFRCEHCHKAHNLRGFFGGYTLIKIFPRD